MNTCGTCCYYNKEKRKCFKFDQKIPSGLKACKQYINDADWYPVKQEGEKPYGSNENICF